MNKFLLLFLFFICTSVSAQEKLLDLSIDARPNDVVPVLQKLSSPTAVNLILIPGGNAGTGEIVNGIPSSQNFLVRSREDFQNAGFNTFILFRAKSVAPGPMSTTYRARTEHLDEIKSLINYISKNTSGPIWLVGTSMGTISATSAAINIDNPKIKGVVLTASVTQTAPGNLASQRLENIKLPVLMIHHESDQCAVCVPSEAQANFPRFKNSLVKDFVMVSGGGPGSGDPCQNQHLHGFIGIESKVTKEISDWIKKNR